MDRLGPDNFSKLQMKGQVLQIAQNAATHLGTFLCEPALNIRSETFVVLTPINLLRALMAC